MVPEGQVISSIVLSTIRAKRANHLGELLV
jgi:hypothetical protein